MTPFQYGLSKKGGIFFFLCSLPLLLLSSLYCIADEVPVRLTGDHLEFVIPERRIVVQGDVNMTGEEVNLSAQRLECDLLSGEGTATGDVRIQSDKGYSLDTPLAEFNIKTGWWRIHSADIWLEPRGYVHCEEAEQVDPNTIRLSRLSFTTCPSGDPDWEVRGRDGVLRHGSSLKVHKLSLRVGRVPLIYLPSSRLPISGARGTGIQPPEAGHSSRHGYFMKNLFTWQATPHTEGRIFFDIFTDTGIGLGSGWSRQRIDQASAGRLYLLWEKENERVHGRGDLSFEKTGPKGRRLAADVHEVSSRAFYKRFSTETAERDARMGESRAFVSVETHGLDLLTEWHHVRALGEYPAQSGQQIPRLACHLPYKPLLTAGSGISPSLGFDCSAAYMEWEAQGKKGEGGAFTIQPVAGLPFSLGEWATLNPSISTRQSYFQNPNQKQQGWSHRYTLLTEITGPHLFRDFKGEASSGRRGEDKGVRHLVYPQIAYQYRRHNGIEPASLMSLEEETGESEYVGFLLVNRIWAKKGTEGGEFLHHLDLVASQNCGLNERRQYTETHINAYPHPMISLAGRGKIYTKGGKRREYDLNLALGNQERGKIEWGWRSLTADDLTEGVNSMRLSLLSPQLKRYRFYISLLYHLKENSMLEEVYRISYEKSCWNGSLALIRRFDEDLIRVRLNLVF